MRPLRFRGAGAMRLVRQRRRATNDGEQTRGALADNLLFLYVREEAAKIKWRSTPHRGQQPNSSWLQMPAGPARAAHCERRELWSCEARRPYHVERAGGGHPQRPGVYGAAADAGSSASEASPGAAAVQRPRGRAARIRVLTLHLYLRKHIFTPSSSQTHTPGGAMRGGRRAVGWRYAGTPWYHHSAGSFPGLKCLRLQFWVCCCFGVGARTKYQIRRGSQNPTATQTATLNRDTGQPP